VFRDQFHLTDRNPKHESTGMAGTNKDQLKNLLRRVEAQSSGQTPCPTSIDVHELLQEVCALPDWPNGDDDATLRVWFNGFETAMTLRKAPIVPMLLQTRLFAEHSGAVPVEELEKTPKLSRG
jgi:hypothetical protein